MEARSDLGGLAVKYGRELEKAARDTKKIIVKALQTAEDLGKQAYSVIEKETRVSKEEAKSLTKDALTQIRKELPGTRKELEKMEREVRKRMEDLEKALEDLM